MFNIDPGFKKRLALYLVGVVLGLFIVVPYIKKKQAEVRLKRNMTIPRIDQKDQFGNLYTLDSLEHKLVLIDFWASWCAPCRGANVQLKYLYQDYHDKDYKRFDNFEILSISLDNNEEEWLAAMEKDSIVWKSIRAEFGREDSIIKRFGIKDIPTTILVDGEGVILAKTTQMDAIKFAIESELVE